MVTCGFCCATAVFNKNNGNSINNGKDFIKAGLKRDGYAISNVIKE